LTLAASDVGSPGGNGRGRRARGEPAGPPSTRENIVFVDVRDIQLKTDTEIEEHFDGVVGFWGDHRRGRKAPEGLLGRRVRRARSVNPRCTEFYATQNDHVIACAITIVRYGGSHTQRAAVRLASMKNHTPSQLYESREQALEVVRAPKAGQLKLAAP
jgi:hypothetical protein